MAAALVSARRPGSSPPSLRVGTALHVCCMSLRYCIFKLGSAAKHSNVRAASGLICGYAAACAMLAEAPRAATPCSLVQRWAVQGGGASWLVGSLIMPITPQGMCSTSSCVH